MGLFVFVNKKLVVDSIIIKYLLKVNNMEITTSFKASHRFRVTPDTIPLHITAN